MITKLLDGRYKVSQVLGQGGFAQTYIAEDTRRPNNPKCVVKHLKPIMANDPSLLQTARRLFQSEAETLEKLGNHDQVPRLLAHFEEDNEFYMVQDIVDGHDISTELTAGKKSTEEYVISLLKELLPVLEFVHGQGVIHRDIKPSNIMRRNSDGKLILIDFGAVKYINTQTAMAHGLSGSVAIGTDGYTPSEQLRGKPRPSSDIYSLGMVALQALTGVYPKDLPEDADEEVSWEHLAVVSPALTSILKKMVSHNTKGRYKEASEVIHDLNVLFPSTILPVNVNPTPLPKAKPSSSYPSQAPTYAVPGVQPIQQSTPSPKVEGSSNKLLLITAIIVSLSAIGVVAASIFSKKDPPIIVSSPTPTETPTSPTITSSPTTPTETPTSPINPTTPPPNPIDTNPSKPLSPQNPQTPTNPSQPVEPPKNNSQPSQARSRNSGILRQGQVLNRGESIDSPSGTYRLILQNDGNLVLYPLPNGRPVWGSGTEGKAVEKAVMQEDGNFVLYSYNGKPVWGSGTERTNAIGAVVTDGGNLRIIMTGSGETYIKKFP